MLLAIDIGNTHVVLGLYQEKELLSSFRLQSDKNRTVDEFALEVLALISSRGVAATDIEQIIISCVVPALSRVFTKLSTKYFGIEAQVVGPGIKTGMVISVDDPRMVGADRIVNAVATKERWGTPAVVVDFGTATTFDVISANGVYDGGLIAPGLLISAQALFDRAALLFTIELKKPGKVIGKNTHDSMLSGIIYGYVGLVDGILERLMEELGQETKVVATGGLSRIISEESRFIQEVDPDLTLEGLRIIAELNR